MAVINFATRQNGKCWNMKYFAKAGKSKQYSFENQLQFLQSNLNCGINSVEYVDFKN